MIKCFRKCFDLDVPIHPDLDVSTHPDQKWAHPEQKCTMFWSGCGDTSRSKHGVSNAEKTHCITGEKSRCMDNQRRKRTKNNNNKIRKSSNWTFINQVMVVLRTYKAKVLKMTKSMIPAKLFISKIRNRVRIKTRKGIHLTLMTYKIMGSKNNNRIIISKFHKE